MHIIQLIQHQQAAITHNLYASGSHGVRIQGVEVPEEIQAGEDVSLKCWVDPLPGPLYSLSWWKDGSQFYRAAVTSSPVSRDDTPSSGTLATVFPLSGLSVKVRIWRCDSMDDELWWVVWVSGAQAS